MTNRVVVKLATRVEPQSSLGGVFEAKFVAFRGGGPMHRVAEPIRGNGFH
ncbi:MAG TPA: hypothetical protein VIV60_27965 [Polyangiaceae bacterium]